MNTRRLGDEILGEGKSTMKLTIDIPDGIEQSLQLQVGTNLEHAAKEVLAIAWYQAEKLSIGQVAELLGISVYEAEGLMKQHRVDVPYSLDDFEHDRATLKRLLGS
jgi:predicted HTH domain antitoxin